MFKNYLKTAIRALYKDKIFALTNLVGLATGLTAVILILSYVRYEFSYDSNYSNAKKTYRLILNNNNENTSKESVYLPLDLTNILQNELPQVKLVTSLGTDVASFIHKNGLIDLKYITSDSNFFKIFNLPFLYGNPNTALNNRNNIVITEKIANKFSPNRNPIGSVMTYKNIYGETRSFQVTGVIKDFPPNMHIQCDAVSAINFSTKTLNWNDPVRISTSLYVMLNKNTSITQVEKLMNNVYRKYSFPKNVTVSFQPVQSIHLHSNISDEFFSNSDIRYIYIYSLIAILILSIACINYINLTTARSLKRLKEIKMRKVLGAARSQFVP